MADGTIRVEVALGPQRYGDVSVAQAGQGGKAFDRGKARVGSAEHTDVVQRLQLVGHSSGTGIQRVPIQLGDFGTERVVGNGGVAALALGRRRIGPIDSIRQLLDLSPIEQVRIRAGFIPLVGVTRPDPTIVVDQQSRLMG